MPATFGDLVAQDRVLDERVDSVIHLAAAVGVGQSMYEIADYVRMNTIETAVFLERLVQEAYRPRRLVVASSMSIYGEGAYICHIHGDVGPPPRPEQQLAERRWECLCAYCGEEVAPCGTPESKQLLPTSIYAITKRDEELCLVAGAAYAIPTVPFRFF